MRKGQLQNYTVAIAIGIIVLAILGFVTYAFIKYVLPILRGI